MRPNAYLWDGAAYGAMARLDAMDIKALGLDWVTRSVRIRQRSGAGVSHRQHILVLEWSKAWCQCRAVFGLLDEDQPIFQTVMSAHTGTIYLGF